MSDLKHFSVTDIKKLQRFYRANLINSVTGYKPANLIGTYAENGIANLALFSSVIHLGANPPLIGYVQRPPGEFSHTYKNIKKTGYYSINHVHETFFEKAHFTSAKFEKDVSEFNSCGLSEEKVPGIEVPFVKESKVRIVVKFLQEMPIPLNNTILMIGQIEHLFLDPAIILADGGLDLNGVDDVCTSGLDTYHHVNRIKSLPYAKVNNLPEF